MLLAVVVMGNLLKFAAELSNCRKLPPNPHMGDFVTQVLGDDIEREVARTMEKVYRSAKQAIVVHSHPVYRFQPRHLRGPMLHSTLKGIWERYFVSIAKVLAILQEIVGSSREQVNKEQQGVHTILVDIDLKGLEFKSL